MLTGPPTTRAERKQVVAAWRAVPLRQRLAVMRSAKAGVRHPDHAAASAAEAFARLVERPRGRYWWQRQTLTAGARVLGGLAVALALVAVLVFCTAGLPRSLGWLAAITAAVELLGAWYNRDLAKGAKQLLAVAPPDHSRPETQAAWNTGWAGTTG